MTYELLLALIGFAFVSSVTPGPNNLMLMASGANFGFRRSLPHMLGISIGHSFQVTMVGLGLGQLFVTYPLAQTILRVLSTAYLLYLAWKIATAAPPADGQAKGRPFTFLQAAAFQWVNPKAWYMAIFAITNYAQGEGILVPALMVAVVFACTNFPSIMLWTTIGTQVKRLLTRPGLLRAFNWTMAALLVATLIPVWMG